MFFFLSGWFDSDSKNDSNVVPFNLAQAPSSPTYFMQLVEAIFIVLFPPGHIWAFLIVQL